MRRFFARRTSVTASAYTSHSHFSKRHSSSAKRLVIPGGVPRMKDNGWFFVQNMNNKSKGKSRAIILCRAITQFGYGFSVLFVLVSITLCLIGQHVSAGILVATGDNGHGQLGNGTITPTNMLSPVLGLGDVSTFAAGGSSAYAIQN